MVVIDKFTSADSYTVNVGAGTYYWKVKQYNATTSTYGTTV